MDIWRCSERGGISAVVVQYRLKNLILCCLWQDCRFDEKIVHGRFE